MIDTQAGRQLLGNRGATAWADIVRTFRVATKLGWQVESNWADPLVFFIFTILRPMASALILVVMYAVIAGGQQGQYFNFMYVSNAFFVLVIQTMSGMAWAVLDDRENYKMLKYVFISPARKFAYLTGRAVAKMALGVLTVVVLLITGVLFLGLKLDIARIEWSWFAVYFLLGVIILLSLGIVLAGIALVVARHGAAIGEVTAGSLLLFCGALFPVDILPGFMRVISLAVPVTYWLEGMRRALLGGIPVITRAGQNGAQSNQPISPILASFDNWQLLAILAFCAVASAIVATWFYGWVERQAKERGMIDRLTGY